MQKKYIVGTVIFVALGGYFWYQRTQTQTTALTYTSVPAEKGMLMTAISGSGNIVIDQSATVDPTITGTVANVAVNVGDAVKKGQVLFTIINEDLTTSTLQSLVSLQNAQVGVSQAKANLSNARDGGTETERDRNILKEKITIAEQSLTVAQLNYKNSLTDSAKRKVTSPIDGTVNAVNIKNGDDLSRLSNSSASQAPIIIGDLQTLKAEVEVNEADIASVSLGQKVSMTLSALDALTLAGRVEKVDALGTITSGVVNYTVTIGLDTADARLRPGMSVSAKIITEMKRDVITVPNSALKVRGNKTYIEVLNQSTGLPEQRTIEMGSSNNTDTEIVSGIAVGDQVITRTIDPSTKTTPTTGSGIRIPGMGGRG